MADYSFRLRLNRSSRDLLAVDEPRLRWAAEGGGEFVLTSGSDEKTIADAPNLYLLGSGWSSAEAAAVAGRRFEAAILRTFASLRIGVAVPREDEPSGGGFTEEIRRQLGTKFDCQVLNDEDGLMVYPTEPPAVFSGGHGSVRRVVPSDEFESKFQTAMADTAPLEPGERLSIELFNASFFEPPDARLLLLVTAIEALREVSPRTGAARAHVGHLIALTRLNHDLTSEEKQSMCGSLRWLLYESIRQSAIKLIDARLHGREYGGKTARRLFSDCYDLRSSIIHGSYPPPKRSEVRHAAANLEVMVSDLLGPASQ